MKKKKSIVNGLRKALVQGRSTKIKNGQVVEPVVETDNGFMNDLLEDIPNNTSASGTENKKTAVKSSKQLKDYSAEYNFGPPSYFMGPGGRAMRRDPITGKCEYI